MLSIVDQIKDTPIVKRREKISYELRALLADFLMLDEADDITETDDFAALGTDSAQAVEFKFQLEDMLDCSLKSTVVFEHPNIGELVDYFLTTFFSSNIKTKVVKEPIAAGEYSDSTTMPIAIIAEAAHFSGIKNSEVLWSNAKDCECLSLTKKSGFDYGKLSATSVGMDEATNQQLLDQLGIAANDAKAHLQDKSLMTALALIDQAMSRHKLSKNLLKQRRVGVFAAAQTSAAKAGQVYTLPLANSLSYLLDLKGPSETLNTFCTSAYVAIHRAANSIAMGECDIALIVGVNLIDQEAFNSTAQAGQYKGLLDGDNQMRSFSHQAKGFVRSEGAGLILITRASLAADNNIPPLAWLLGSAVGHGGRSYSIEAPNAGAMRQTIDDCFSASGLSSDQVDYIEAHGIGNQLADAIELGALSEAYASHSLDGEKRWQVGTVKPTLGHPEIAAGMASLIKAIYAIRHKTMPGIAGFTEINQDVSDDHRLRLSEQSQGWSSAEAAPRVAALNSYAIGGVNAHMLIGEVGVNDDLFIRHNPMSARAGAVAGTLHELNKEIPELNKTKLKLNNDQLTVLNAISEDILGLSYQQLDLRRSAIDYGFDSVTIVNLCRHINSRLQCNIKLGELLSLQTFAELNTILNRHLVEANKQVNRDVLALQSSYDHTILMSASEIDKCLQQALALSEIQKGLWLIQQSKTKSSSFNVPILFKIPNDLNAGTLQAALDVTIAQHPALQMKFVHDEQGERVTQCFNAEADYSIHTLNLSAAETALDRCRELLRQPFKLASDALLRCYYLNAKAQSETHLYFVIHHIVIDGFSGTQFVQTFWENYQALNQGENLLVSEVRKEFGFAYYLQWEQGYISSDAAEQDRKWWQQQLSNIELDRQLPYEKTDGLAENVNQAVLSAVGCQTLHWDANRSAELSAFANRHNVNLSVVILSAFSVLLRVLTQKDEVLVTSPVGGRPQAGLERSIGCFINVIVTRCIMNTEHSFEQLLQQVKTAFIDAIDHGDYPFPMLGGDLGIGMMKPDQQAFPVSYTYQNIFDGWPNELLQALDVSADFSIFQETDDYYTLEVYDFRERLEIKLKYQQACFGDTSIQRHLQYLNNILQQVISKADIIINNIDYMSAAEKDFLCQQRGQSVPMSVPAAGEAASDNKLSPHIVDLFLRQAERRPEALAIIDGEHQWTYKALAEQVFYHAHQLELAGVLPGQIALVIMPRSVEAIIAMLAILHCGAAYLPIEADGGCELLSEVLPNKVLLDKVPSGKKVKHNYPVISVMQHGENEQNYCDLLASLGIAVLYIVPEQVKKYNDNPITLTAHAIPRHADDLACVIYKDIDMTDGVMISHAGLSAVASTQAKCLELKEHDRGLPLFPTSSIGAICDIFPYLLHGASIVLSGAVMKEGANNDLYNTLSEHNVTALTISPAFYDSIRLLGQEKKSQLLRQLNVVNFSGESLPASILEDAKQYSLGTCHHYSCAEYLLALTMHDDKITCERNLNTQLYVLDDRQQLSPTACVGDLYVNGQALSLGYFNHDIVTSQAFINHPLGEGRLFKTNDLARWDANGELSFLGRRDQRVKRRGYVTSLMDIEKALNREEHIHIAAVVQQSAGQSANTNNSSIIAFFTAETVIDIADLKARMSTRIADYMLPDAWVQLEVLPLTRSGKIDRQELAQTQLDEDEEEFIVLPRDAQEQTMCDIWREVLALDSVGIDCDFFNLGGHSLLAIQIISRANKAFNTSIPMALLFEAGSIRKLIHGMTTTMLFTDRSEQSQKQRLAMFQEKSNTILL